MSISARAVAAAFALAVGFVCLAHPADARPRRTTNEIVVTKRSYFDAGTKVKPGTGGQLNYVYAGQGLATPDYEHIGTEFGDETLPRRWELPGFPSRRMP